MDLINYLPLCNPNLFKELNLPKPTPIYTLPTLFPTNVNFRQQTVIKSIGQCLPKCDSPKIQLASGERVLPKAATTHRLSYPREYKLMVIDYYFANGQNKYRTCKQFRITKSMLNGWLQKAEKILKSRPGSLKTGRSGRRPQFPNVEEELYKMCLELESKGYKIENEWIKEGAQKLASKYGIKSDENKSHQFSERWLTNFKRRYNITIGKQRENSVKMNEKVNYLKTIDVDSTTCSSLQTSNQTTTQQNVLKAEMILSHFEEKSPIQTFYDHFPWFCDIPPVSPTNNKREQIIID